MLRKEAKGTDTRTARLAAWGGGSVESSVCVLNVIAGGVHGQQRAGDPGRSTQHTMPPQRHSTVFFEQFHDLRLLLGLALVSNKAHLSTSYCLGLEMITCEERQFNRSQTNVHVNGKL